MQPSKYGLKYGATVRLSLILSMRFFQQGVKSTFIFCEV